MISINQQIATVKNELKRKKRTFPNLIEEGRIKEVDAFTYILPFLLGPFCWWQLSLIAGQHFIQDRTTFVPWFLKVSGKAKFAEPPMAPWSMIVVDNTFHLMWIGLVLSLGI